MMTARIMLAGQAPAYHPPLHEGVEAVRLQGMEAGPTDRFWVGHSTYAPGGAAQLSPTAEETVYLVLGGELVLSVPQEGPDQGRGLEQVLRVGDSVHMTRGTVRSVVNRSSAPAQLLVIIAIAPKAE
jgi:hypothetical protein